MPGIPPGPWLLPSASARTSLVAITRRFAQPVGNGPPYLRSSLEHTSLVQSVDASWWPRATIRYTHGRGVSRQVGVKIARENAALAWRIAG